MLYCYKPKIVSFSNRFAFTTQPISAARFSSAHVYVHGGAGDVSQILAGRNLGNIRSHSDWQLLQSSSIIHTSPLRLISVVGNVFEKPRHLALAVGRKARCFLHLDFQSLHEASREFARAHIRARQQKVLSHRMSQTLIRRASHWMRARARCVARVHGVRRRLI